MDSGIAPKLSMRDEVLTMLEAPDVERLKADKNVEGLAEALSFYAHENWSDKIDPERWVAWDAETERHRREVPAAAIPDAGDQIHAICVDVRRAAAKALGELGGQQAIEALSDALADPDFSVCDSAIAALEAIGGNSAARVLEEFAEATESQWHRDQALFALKMIELRSGS